MGATAGADPSEEREELQGFPLTPTPTPTSPSTLLQDFHTPPPPHDEAVTEASPLKDASSTADPQPRAGTGLEEDHGWSAKAHLKEGLDSCAVRGGPCCGADVVELPPAGR